METVYEKYRPAHEVLIEYYAYEDLRRILKIEWEHEDELYKKHSDILWIEYETSDLILKTELIVFVLALKCALSLRNSKECFFG